MTQEDKNLLLKDLCGRLPYGVKYKTYLGDVFTLKDITFSKTTTEYYIDDNAFSVDQIKPYLRPMLSMTEEEEIIYEQLIKDVHYKPRESTCCKLISWLNEHYFDYDYLIEKGLALEATEGMYNT